MNTAIVDTSAMMRLFIPDGPLPEGLEENVQAALQGEAVLLAPELALAEAAQVLWKKEREGIIQSRESSEILDALLGLPLDFVSHRPLMIPALRFAHQFNLTVYDALFCTLARERNGALLTADERVAEAFIRARG